MDEEEDDDDDDDEEELEEQCEQRQHSHQTRHSHQLRRQHHSQESRQKPRQQQQRCRQLHSQQRDSEQQAKPESKLQRHQEQQRPWSPASSRSRASAAGDLRQRDVAVNIPSRAGSDRSKISESRVSDEKAKLSAEKLQALEAETASQKQQVRDLESLLRGAQNRACRLEASEEAAQLEIEAVLSQLKASQAEVRAQNAHIQQLEGRLQNLEREAKPSRMTESSPKEERQRKPGGTPESSIKDDRQSVSIGVSSDGTRKARKIAELEEQVAGLTKQLRLSKKQLQEGLAASEQSNLESLALAAERKRTAEWQDRCELLRKSLQQSETAASAEIEESQRRLRDEKYRVQNLSAELAGVQEAGFEAVRAYAGPELEARTLSQKVSSLEAEIEKRKERAAKAEALLGEVEGELDESKAARVRTLSHLKDVESELEVMRRKLANAEREAGRAEIARQEAEDRATALRDDNHLLTAEVKEVKLELANLDVLGRSSILSSAKADALIESSRHHDSMADLTTSAGEGEEDLFPHRIRGSSLTNLRKRPVLAYAQKQLGGRTMSASEIRAERASGALDEARRELTRQQKEANGLRRELAVAVAAAVGGKEADPPQSRRRSGLRLRMEQEAVERLALGASPAGR